MKQILPFFCVFLLFACQSNKKSEKSNISQAQVSDPHSFAEPQQAVVKHLDLDLTVDFDSKILKGKAVWTIENSSGGDEIVFDTRQLQIQKVTLDDDESQEAMFALGDEEKYLGQPLSIEISPSTKKVTIWYTTSKDAAAIQWLSPAQTAGKKLPFLYTQSQAILARTWIPCQDSPGIRFTYDAKVSVPTDLLALMSAVNPQKKNSQGVYEFKQEKPIPSYLMALAVGDIAFKTVDGRTGVYAEPVALEKAAWEFADMGKMVDAAEELYGKYQWERYDILVLPPSFPFGGMENPILTFATPTVIAGDRSLVSLVAHELAHSWSGNLATNATWNDFWLNEGFTTYFERRIIEAVYGAEEAKMQEVLGRQSLQLTVDGLDKTNPDTRLKTDFTGRDPDEGVSDIAYEKGYFFLKTIEQAVGRKKFDGFIKDYFQSHAFKSVTTEEFLKYLDEHLIHDDPALKGKIQVDSWVYKPGIPSNIPPVSSNAFSTIDTIIAGLNTDFNVKGLSQKVKTTNEKLYFITQLPQELTAPDLAALDTEFNFTTSNNAEIQSAWYQLAIKNNYKKAYPNIEKFLISVGRRKFLMPLYKSLLETKEGKAIAKKIYEKAHLNYHSVASSSIEELLKESK